MSKIPISRAGFIPNTETCAPLSDRPHDSAPTREPIRILVIGSIQGIDLIVGILHRLGFAEARAWSKPQRDPASGKPMRVLTKWIRH